MSSDPIEVLRDMKVTMMLNDYERSALDAALASLSAPKPESAKAVGEVFGPKAVSHMVALKRPLPPGTKLYTAPPRPEVMRQAVELREAAEAVVEDHTDYSARIRLRKALVEFDTAPQQASAPVGVEDWRRLGGAQRFLDWNRKQAEPPVRIGWEHQVFEGALDQQPAAVDGAMVERGAKAGWGSIPIGCQWQELDPPTRSNWRRIARAVLTAALAAPQQGGES